MVLRLVRGRVGRRQVFFHLSGPGFPPGRAHTPQGAPKRLPVRFLTAYMRDLEDYEFSSGTLQDKMLELSNGKYADREKVNEKYAVNLFSSVAEEYTVLETLDSTVIENFTSGTLKTGWDSFWSSLTGGSQWNYEYEDLQALYEVQPEDITGNAETVV